MNFAPSTPAFFRWPAVGLLMRCGLMNSTKPELHRIVAVRGGRLALHHHARPRLEQRDRHGLPVGPEHLRHSNLFAKDSWAHR